MSVPTIVRAALQLLLVGFSSSQSSNVSATEATAAHNLYRAKAGTPPLQWSDGLADGALQWARLLIARGTYQPERNGRFGENLFEIVGGHATERQVVAAWAAESAHYDARRNSCSARCGHYTQIVWRETRRVGCGVARDSRREVWVCRYEPPGNFVGERPY